MDIVDIFQKSPLSKSNEKYNATNTAGDLHLQAILHNEIFDNNNHSRVTREYNKPEFRTINFGGVNQHWLFMPTMKEYTYNEVKPLSSSDLVAQHKKIVNMYMPHWERMTHAVYADPTSIFVVDCRSMKTRGPALIAAFAPFVHNFGSKVLETKNPVISGKQFLYIGNQPPYISKEPVESVPVALGDANVKFIIDKTFAKVKDTYFTLLMANLTHHYEVFGDPGEDIGYIYSQYQVEEKDVGLKDSLLLDKKLMIRIPDTRIEIEKQIVRIPESLMPYKVNQGSPYPSF